MVSALSADRRSVQMCRDFEKVRSTETLVAGIAKKSLAMRAKVGNDAACCCGYHRELQYNTVIGTYHDTFHHPRGFEISPRPPSNLK
jgi:hypothetical protein